MRKAASFLVALAVSVVSAKLLAQNHAHSLRDLLAGVPVSKKARLGVRDITVGSRSVLPLFQLSSGSDNRYGRYVGHTDRLVMKLRNREAMNELRQILLEAGSSAVLIHLTDTGFLAKTYGKLPKAILPKLDIQATLTLPIEIEITPCERITRIIYREIDLILQRQLVRAAETGEAVTLDDVFQHLIEGTLNQYLDTLDASTRDDPCFATYDLLKWVRNEEARGFAFSEYAITSEMNGVLRAIAGAIGKVRNAQRYKMQVDVVGFSDDTPFKKYSNLPTQAKFTGVASLRDPLRIFYDGCIGDYATEVRFVGLRESSAEPVGTSISNNCELGAARAYVALSALSGMVGTDLAYRYASGGVAASGTTATAAEKRKIAIRIHVRTATTR